MVDVALVGAGDEAGHLPRAADRRVGSAAGGEADESDLRGGAKVNGVFSMQPVEQVEGGGERAQEKRVAGCVSRVIRVSCGVDATRQSVGRRCCCALEDISLAHLRQ